MRRALIVPKRTWALAFLGALGLVALIKFLPTQTPPRSLPIPIPKGNVTGVVFAVTTGGTPPTVRRLSCTAPVPSSLTVARGTLLELDCPSGIHVASLNRALLSESGRHGEVYVLAYRVGKGTIHLGAYVVTVTVHR